MLRPFIPRGNVRLLLRRQPRCLFRRLSSTNAWSADAITGLVYRNQEKEAVFQTIIGLEIHAQLQIPTKLFSTTNIQISNPAPNTQLSLLDIALPGSLPVLSAAAVQAAVLAAAALQCQIATVSRFERKHYVYADLPAGYQITQQRWPLAVDGCINFSSAAAANNTKKRKKKQQSGASDTNVTTCRIERLQLEQDTAKTVQRTVGSKTESLVDFNRAGSALIEIVTAPDIRSAAAAVQATETVRQLLRHTGVCDGQLQSGSLRVDLNVNLQDSKGRRSLRVEVKNLNSLRQVQEAALFEAVRQAQAWSTDNEDDTGGDQPQQFSETRTWNVLDHKTVLIRLKDSEQDYRFLPEPDLPPVVLNAETLDGCQSVQDFCDQRMPELPAQALERLMETYSLSHYQATVVAADPPAILLLDTAIATAQQLLDESSHSIPPAKIAQLAANLLTNELFALVKEDAPESDHVPTVQTSAVTGQQLGEIVVLLATGSLSSTMAKKLLAVIYTQSLTGASPAQVAAEHGFQLVTDSNALLSLCRQVLADHPAEVGLLKQGGKFVGKMQKLFTGKAMAASHGNAHPERLQEALQNVMEETIDNDE